MNKPFSLLRTQARNYRRGEIYVSILQSLPYILFCFGWYLGLRPTLLYAKESLAGVEADVTVVPNFTPEKRKIAVAKLGLDVGVGCSLPFSMNAALTDVINTELLDLGYSVQERTALKTLLQEQEFSQSYVAEQDIPALAQLQGVDEIFLGALAVTDCAANVTAEFSGKIIDASTGEILAIGESIVKNRELYGDFLHSQIVAIQHYFSQFPGKSIEAKGAGNGKMARKDSSASPLKTSPKIGMVQIQLADPSLNQREIQNVHKLLEANIHVNLIAAGYRAMERNGITPLFKEQEFAQKYVKEEDSSRLAQLLGIDKIFISTLAAVASPSETILFSGKIVDLESGQYELAGYVISPVDSDTMQPKEQAIQKFFDSLLNDRQKTLADTHHIVGSEVWKAAVKRQELTAGTKLAVVEWGAANKELDKANRELLAAGYRPFARSDVDIEAIQNEWQISQQYVKEDEILSPFQLAGVDGVFIVLARPYVDGCSHFFIGKLLDQNGEILWTGAAIAPTQDLARRLFFDDNFTIESPEIKAKYRSCIAKNPNQKPQPKSKEIHSKRNKALDYWSVTIGAGFFDIADLKGNNIVNGLTAGISASYLLSVVGRMAMGPTLIGQFLYSPKAWGLNYRGYHNTYNIGARKLLGVGFGVGNTFALFLGNKKRNVISFSPYFTLKHLAKAQKFNYGYERLELSPMYALGGGLLVGAYRRVKQFGLGLQLGGEILVGNLKINGTADAAAANNSVNTGKLWYIGGNFYMGIAIQFFRRQ